MADFAHVKRCLDLTDRDIDAAIGQRRSAKALFEHLARISEPGAGAAKVVTLLARVAAAAVPWVEGDLRVEMASDGDVTWVEVLSEMGQGMRERVFPLARVNAPLKEFARLMEQAPSTVAPLTVGSKSSRRLVLVSGGSTEDMEDAESAAPSVSIAEESMYAATRRASKPRLGATKSGQMRAPAVPATSSGRMRAARRLSKPRIEVEDAGAKVLARSGDTLKPSGMAAPAPTRTKTLRPTETGVPPQLARVSVSKFRTALRAPRVPRMTEEPPAAGAAKGTPPAPARGSKPPRRMSTSTAKAVKPASERAARRRSAPPEGEDGDGEREPGD